MSPNPPAPVFLPHFQSSSDPPIPLGHSTTRSLPLAQLFCRMPLQITPFHAPSITQHITDGTFFLPSLEPTNQSKPNAAAHQPTPDSSALLPSPLQHQAHWLLTIHKTIQQFSQHLKAEHLDRQALQILALHLQNDFALLRYLLFSDKDYAATDSATSLPINPNPNRNSNPTSSALTLPCTADTKLLPRWALWDHPERKQTVLQTPTINLHSKRRKLLQLRCRTLHQEFTNWKTCLPMK